MALTTKLNAVNTMISVIGEAPVNTLGGTAVPVSVVQAEAVLDENPVEPYKVRGLGTLIRSTSTHLLLMLPRLRLTYQAIRFE